MIRKALMGLGLVVFGSYLWMGTSLGSYARTSVAEAMGFIRGQVPVEFEIKRAQQLLKELVPEIHNTHRTIVEEEVKLARLDQEIDQMTANLDAEQAAILALREQLAKGLVAYRIGSRDYSGSELRGELARRFTGFKRASEAVRLKEEIRGSREAGLRAAQEKCQSMIESKEALASELALLEARLKMVEAKQAGNRFQVDATPLARIREQISEINDRLLVEEKVAEQEGSLLKRIPVEAISPEDLEAQIDGYFGTVAAQTGAKTL